MRIAIEDNAADPVSSFLLVQESDVFPLSVDAWHLRIVRLGLLVPNAKLPELDVFATFCIMLGLLVNMRKSRWNCQVLRRVGTLPEQNAHIKSSNKVCFKRDIDVCIIGTIPFWTVGSSRGPLWGTLNPSGKVRYVESQWDPFVNTVLLVGRLSGYKAPHSEKHGLGWSLSFLAELAPSRHSRLITAAVSLEMVAWRRTSVLLAKAETGTL